MKRLFRFGVAAILIGLFVAPAAFGDDETKVVKRIFVRDGEVIEIDGEPMEWNGKLLDIGRSERTFLGVHVLDITRDLRTHYGAPEDQGVLVAAISDDSPASKAGLQAGDVLMSIDGKPLSSAGSLRRMIREHASGDAVELEIIRDGSRQTLYATLAERTVELPKFDIRGDSAPFRYRLDKSEPALKKLQEYFDSPEWETRVSRLPNCAEIQAKLEVVQKRLEEMEKRLDKMK